MNYRTPAILILAAAMFGCASINPFEYTAAHVLDGPHAAVCWGRVDTTNPTYPCENDQAAISLKECVVELKHAASLYTVEDVKQEMLLECMFDKRWQIVHLIGFDAPPR